jgi:MFS family permease
VPGLSFGAACVLRFLTGVAMAFVYPPGMKAAATWFRRGRGLGLGLMVAALCVGSALPNVLIGARWQVVVATTSAVAGGGALLALRGADGPFPFRGVSQFQCSLVVKCLGNPGTMLAILAYTAHNWELYALWSWFRAFTSASLEAHHGYSAEEADATAGLVTFCVVSAGAVGCVVGGICGDRYGRCKTAAAMLCISCACALAVGRTFDGPLWRLVAVGVVWGASSVGDSAQYSAMVTEVTDAEAVGTAVTLQLALGYTVTCVTVFLVPVWESALGWGWVFALLSPPNVVAVAALARLYTHPAGYKRLIAGGAG